jgi:DNA-directed RNA polymerase specialized sigma24 family protein
VALFRPSDKNEIILELRPWISGFALKEYGHVDPQDREDIAQEGCLRLIEIVNDLERKPERFVSKEEYIFYVKACVRNSVRDYILKLRSKFDISLYKLRRELRCECPNRPRYHLDICTKKELGDFMTAVGDEFAGFHAEEEAEDPHEWERRQRRLSLLAGVRKSGRGMGPEECQRVLGEVLHEFKRHLVEEGRWTFQPSPSRIAALNPEQMQEPAANLPHARTPLGSTAMPATRVVKCSNRFCETDLREVRSPVVYRGYGYCSKSCRKEWPPVIIKLQSQYEAPIEVILEVALKMFRSKRRTAEMLNIAATTMERLVTRFSIREIGK